MARTCDPPGRPRPAYRIALRERATIVARGEALETWWVRVNDGWVRASEHPAITATSRADADIDEHGSGESQSSDDAACPSGTVWHRTLELLLQAGTEVLLRQTWPRTRRLSVMGYLESGLGHTQRTINERRFIVSGNYKLTPIGRRRTQALVTKHPSSARPERDDYEVVDTPKRPG